MSLSIQQRNLLTNSWDIVFLHSSGCINILLTANNDYTDYRVVYVISEANVGGRWLPFTGIHHLKISGGYFDMVRAQFQGIKVGQEAHQEGDFNDRYLENSIIYTKTLSSNKFPS